MPSHSPDVNFESYRAQLARFARQLGRLGYAPGSAGNLSVRLRAGEVLATPTGCRKCDLRPADMVVVDEDGEFLHGTRNVTSEIGMHLAVYRARPDVFAVVHAHPPIATGFACSGIALDKPLCSEVLMCIGPVPLAAYATTGTDEVAASLKHLVVDHDAILLANHGVVTFGTSVEEAFLRMETVEHSAHIALVARQLGGGIPLTSEQIEALRHARMRYSALSASTPGKRLKSGVTVTQ